MTETGDAYFIFAVAYPKDRTCGAGAEAVVYDAPSPAAARNWADRFLEEQIFADRVGFKLERSIFVPVDRMLITDERETPIDWAAIANREEFDHTEAGAHGVILQAGATPDPDALSDGEALERFRASPDGARYNWDVRKQAYYIFWTPSQAYVVRGMNMTAASFSFRQCRRLVLQESKVSFQRCPGACRYEPV